MKRLFNILLLCFLTVQLSAKCGPGQLVAWPNGSTLSQTGFIIIDGSGTYEEAVLNLGKKYPIYLKAGVTIVTLNIKTIHKGQCNQSQAILVPNSTLIVGQTYELIIDSLPNGRKISRQSEAVKWTIVNSNDIQAPTLNKKPILKSKTYKVYGCGPESFLTYKFSGSDNSEFLIVVTVKFVKTNKSITYYLPHDQQTFILGHGMCYGEFSFAKGQRYELVVGLIDSNGNTTYWPDKLYFRGPTLVN